MKGIFAKMDKTLLFLSIISFVFGLIMIFSASSMESYMRYGLDTYHYFTRQAMFLGGGFLIFLFVINLPTKTYKGLSYLLIIASIGVLIALTAYGKMSNNAQSWFKLGTLSLQPSEFIKIFMIMFLATYYDNNKDNLDNSKILFIPLIPIFIIFILVAMQPDLGTALIIFAISFLVFFSLPMPRKLIRKFNMLVLLLIIICATGLFLGGKYILKDYQLERFNFLDPCERYQDESGYQLCNSFIAFKNGGVTGQGIGKSTQKYLYLPESYTDFIFPIIVEEWGAWMGCLIVFIYFVIIYRLYSIARKSNSLYTSILAYGVCVYVFVHIAINLVGVMGLAPLTGVPLPFLSYGGSYAISLMFALGVAERVSIENNKRKRG